jgi:hypothetical protein
MTVCVSKFFEVALDNPDLDSDCVRCKMFTPTETCCGCRGLTVIEYKIKLLRLASITRTPK